MPKRPGNTNQKLLVLEACRNPYKTGAELDASLHEAPVTPFPIGLERLAVIR